MPLELTFGGSPYTPPPGGQLAFEFKSVPPARSMTIAGVLPRLTGLVRLERIEPPRLMVIAGVLPKIQGMAQLTWSSNVWRGLAVGTSSGWREARPMPVETGSGWRASRPLPVATDIPSRDAQPMAAGTTAGWRGTQPLAAGAQADWNDAAALATAPITASWKGTAQISQARDVSWRDALPVSRGLNGAWRCPPTRYQPIDLGWRDALPLVQVLTGQAGRGAPLPIQADIPWRDGCYLQGISWPFPPPPGPPPVYRPPTGSELVFVFGRRMSRALIFRFGRQLETLRPIVIPIRRVYRVLNAASVVRLPDRAEIPARSVRLKTDFDSWTWGIDVTLAGQAAAEMLLPQSGVPWEIEVSAQGRLWTGVVDRVTGSESHGSRSFRATARSRAAYLGPGYMRERTYLETQAKTRVQLAEQELTNTGWTLVWSPAVPSALVPAKAWSYQGLTPIEAIRRLAQSAGAEVQAHQALNQITVLKRYAITPWEWDTTLPDIMVPADVVKVLDWGQRSPLQYDAVFVSGSGVLAKVKRTGTAGTTIPSQPLVNALVTDVSAARALGERFLAESSPVLPYSLDLPLHPEGGDVPLILPGQLVAFQRNGQEWRGLAGGVEVSVETQGRALSIRQAVRVNETGNSWSQFTKLLPSDPLLVATVISHETGQRSVVQFPAGGTMTVIGTAVEVGRRAYIQGGRIVEEAPEGTYYEIEV